MPLTVVRSDSNSALWGTCVARFLDEVAESAGATEHAAHLWLTHRAQRDRLLEEAEVAASDSRDAVGRGPSAALEPVTHRQVQWPRYL